METENEERKENQTLWDSDFAHFERMTTRLQPSSLFIFVLWSSDCAHIPCHWICVFLCCVCRIRNHFHVIAFICFLDLHDIVATDFSALRLCKWNWCFFVACVSRIDLHGYEYQNHKTNEYSVNHHRWRSSSRALLTDPAALLLCNSKHLNWQSTMMTKRRRLKANQQSAVVRWRRWSLRAALTCSDNDIWQRTEQEDESKNRKKR